MNRTFVVVAVLSINAALAAPRAASAQASDSSVGQGADEFAMSESEFSLSFSPYLWMTSLSGSVAVEGVTSDVDVSFGDILEESDSIVGLMGVLDAEYGRLVFQFSGAYSKADFSDERGRAEGVDTDEVELSVDVDLDLDLSAAWLEFFGGYRFVDSPFDEDDPGAGRLTLDGFVGARITSIDIDSGAVATATVTLTSGTVLQAGSERSIGEDETWVEPFVGARLGMALGEHFTLSLRGDVGGFGIDGSEFSWQTIAAIGYRLVDDGWSLDVFAGYRALGQDYSDGTFEWDMITHGPILGLRLGFRF